MIKTGIFTEKFTIQHHI